MSSKVFSVAKANLPDNRSWNEQVAVTVSDIETGEGLTAYCDLSFFADQAGEILRESRGGPSFNTTPLMIEWKPPDYCALHINTVDGVRLTVPLDKDRHSDLIHSLLPPKGYSDDYFNWRRSTDKGE